MLAKILRLKRSKGNVSLREKVTAGGDSEQYNYNNTTNNPANVAFPFRDEKATSFPAPLSVDVSVLTDGQKSAAAIAADATEEGTQIQDAEKEKKKEQKKKKKGKDEKVDHEEEQEEKQKIVKKDVSRSDLKETCSPESCNRSFTHKSPLDNDVIPTKLTEMINTSIKEAVQTIVKQCSMVSKKQENEKPSSKVKHKQDPLNAETKISNKYRGKEKMRDEKQYHCSRSTKVHEKSKDSNLSPCRHKRSSSERKSLDSKKEKTLEERSKKLSKIEKNLKSDNRRMTGNVNIYICSEATENTQVNGKKKDKAPPCVESSSETMTERSTETCSRRDSCLSSKLRECIEKRRKKLQKEREQLDCFCEKVSSRNDGSEASSTVSGASWRTEYKNSRPIPAKRDNDLRNVQDSSSGDIAVLDSFSTSSTRDGCLCNDTNVSDTDMINDSEVSLLRSRFTACERNLYDSRIYPLKSQVSSIESDNWEPTTVCTNDYSKHQKGYWTENVDDDRECRCVDPRLLSFEDSWTKRNVCGRKRRRFSSRNRKENWSTCSCIREEDEEHCSIVEKVCKVPSEKLSVCRTTPVEQTTLSEKIIPCPAFIDDAKSSPKEITVCCNVVSQSKPKHEEQTVCTTAVCSVEPEMKRARDSEDAEEKDVLSNGEQADTSRQSSVDESQRKDSKDEEYRRESLTPSGLSSQQTKSKKIAGTKKSAGKAPVIKTEPFTDKDKEVDRLESKKTLDEEKKESFLSRLLRIIGSVFKPSQGKADKKKKEESDDEGKIKEMEKPKDDGSKVEISADVDKKIEARDAEENSQRLKTTGIRKMKNVRSVYSLDKGERPKTKLEVILESRKGVSFTPKQSMVFRRAAAGGEANEEDIKNDNERKVPLSSDASRNSKKEVKSSSFANKKDSGKSSATKSAVGSSAGNRQQSRFRQSISAEKTPNKSDTARTSITSETRRRSGQYPTTRTSISRGTRDISKKLRAGSLDAEKDVEQSQTRKDATSDEEKLKKDTTVYVPCEKKKSEENKSVCRCKQPDTEDCARTCNHCPKCKKSVKQCCCEKEEKEKEICCDCTCSSKAELFPKCGPCCKCNEPVTCGKCDKSKTDCKCKKIIVCASCCKPVEECSCRCRKPLAKCFKSPEICWYDKQMICVYCENPRDYCTCRVPVQKCSYCGLLLDVCSCRNPETCSLVGREILNDKNDDRMMCVTSWRPRKDVRRYFSRNMEDECCCHEKPKPYGCEELPYQRLRVFSNVMNELQQKISESVCCTRCRRVPCCCGTKLDRDDDRKDGKSKYRVLDNCRCGVITQKNDQPEHTASFRICCVCRTSPCRCKKGKSSLRKPRAKCYYCKSSPCTCVTATEHNKARPCRCSTSPYRGKEEEIRSRVKSTAGSKNDGKLFCVRGSKVSICPASRKPRHSENSENAGRRRRENLNGTK